MTTVSIYEDNDELRSLLQLLIGGAEGFSVVGAYGNGQQVEEQVRRDHPDVVLMDIDMPGRDGIECVRLLKEANVDIRVLMHTVFDDDDRLFNCLSNGANGYLLKKDTSVRLLSALSEVAEGGGPMSPGIARRVLKTFMQAPPSKRETYGITDRERQILQLLTQGYTYRMIGLRCTISVETVRRHLKNIYQKLHVQCGTEAVAKALRERII
ncbi:response regulator [Spirosoma utsteinense]|uniref:DNA-binding NarL/FixJ family response regulator n=1 Tax=Spirosoma utsteinense TaxID=2585773 RepID=A0ABR6WCI6_9BACT|nr:response regulator transcription factor [Spirosoma utsteinense]MBC3788322.1 DNA-binding NarL/FixJ family response regulator [Spirosoma utsteinense]MBC3794228.1 DNA-binding NarL/FixJ family response regulator [Spirosoma utsteinense]